MPPKVSVGLITYNHEKHIKECLDSILEQQVNFEFEIVIGEDKSKDNTLAIVSEYQQKHPDIIRLITSENNVGMVANWERTLLACKGHYIAIIEGDDCWISQHKLQKQVDLLEKHPEYALCFHSVEVEFGDGVAPENPLVPITDGTEFSIKEVILRNWFIPTCSMMIRRGTLAPFPAWTKGLQSIDIVVQLMVAMHGNIGYIDEKMGLYRVHGAGISQVQWLGNANRLQLSFIEIFKHFDRYSKGRYHQYVSERLQRGYSALMKQNPPRSSVYLKAMANTIACNPGKNLVLLKHYVILNLVPAWIYKTYRNLK